MAHCRERLTPVWLHRKYLRSQQAPNRFHLLPVSFSVHTSVGTRSARAPLLTADVTHYGWCDIWCMAVTRVITLCKLRTNVSHRCYIGNGSLAVGQTLPKPVQLLVSHITII